MGYNAHQRVSRVIHRGDDDGKHDDLIMEGANYASVENDFYLCSAYEPDEITSPWDVVQKQVEIEQISSERGGDFTWSDDNIKEMADEIKELFPDHEDTPKVLAELEAIKKRANDEDCYDFVCY